MTTRDLNSFVSRIRQMNETFKLDINDKPTDLGEKRLIAFTQVLSNEVAELDEIDFDEEEDHAIDLVGLADCLADIVVYVFSEAQRWGIPLTEVLHAVMDSQDSKLVDGKPLFAPDGSKFIKGPNYQPPEPMIQQILERYKNGSTTTE